MKSIKYILTFLLSVFVWSLQAQDLNRLEVKSVIGAAGKEVNIPIALTNDQEIVAVQFNLHLPFSKSSDNVELVAERANGHSVSVRALGDNVYTVVIVSMENRALKGNSGVLLNFPMHVDAAAQADDVYNMTITDAILSVRDGRNIASESLPGTYTVKRVPTPDLTVENVKIANDALQPGAEMTVSWAVKNVGNEMTRDGWSENVYLQSPGGEKIFVGRVYSDAILAQGVSLPRSATFKLPQLVGLDGEVQAFVELVTTTETGELNSDRKNNSGVSTGTVNLDKLLYLEADGNRLKEGDTTPLRFRVSRSGFWDMAETFQVKTANQHRLSVPATVTIPQGQSGVYFYVNAVDNAETNTYLTETVSVEGQNGYPGVSQVVDIEDNEFMTLHLESDKAEIVEGQSFFLTIRRQSTIAADTVYLSCEKPNDFTYPKEVVFLAQEESKQVEIKAHDDDRADVDHTVAFYATSAHYNKAEQLIILKDNDVPDITLDLTPSTINEGAGYNAIMATLRRTSATNSRITIKLTDDSNGRLQCSTRTIVLEKGTTEAQFSIGVVDNGDVDGTCEYELKAAVYISSCDCSGSASNKGTVTHKITVLDNDGPSLNLMSSASMVQEGSSTGAELIIRHNVGTEMPVNITLSSKDESMVFPKQVAIPAGFKEVRVPVTAQANEVEGDSRTVVIEATSEGFTKGTCWIMVSDQTLPDAYVADFAVNTLEPEAEGSVVAKLKVGNSGVRELPAGTKISYYLSGTKDELKSFATTEAIAPGATADFEHTLNLPGEVGEYVLSAKLNQDQKIKECLSVNNDSPKLTLKLRPPYTLTAVVDEEVVDRGASVTIYGKASGSKIANVPVEVYILNDGGRTQVQTTTDVAGNYQVVWTPEVHQMGEFAVGACYPGSRKNLKMDTFNIYGLRRVNAEYITCQTLVGEKYEGAFTIENPSNLDLHNVVVDVLSAPANCKLTFGKTPLLSKGKKISVLYTLLGSAATEGMDWEEIKLRIHSDEMASLDMSMFYFCRSPKGKLHTATHRIETTMVKGSSRDYSLKITNVGKGETGKISLALPKNQTWMTAVTPVEMASLKPDETTTVILRFTPTENMELNVPLSGKIGLNCENGDGIPVNFRIETVSDQTGKLVLDVCDENTYYTAGAPHLKGAEVVIKHPTTGALITQGVTGEDGLYQVELPEGYYSVGVAADNHDTYKATLMVDPGKETKRIVNLSFQAIKVDWDVVETEVEDKYDIVTTVKYETHVPVPVLDVVVPDSIPIQEIKKNGSCLIYAVLTNKGYITAKNIHCILAEAEGFQYEYLVEQGFSLPASQSMMVPIRVKFDEKATGSLACMVTAVVDWSWDCGTDLKTQRITLGIKAADCVGYIPTYEEMYRPVSAPSGQGQIIDPIVGEGNHSVVDYVEPQGLGGIASSDVDCDPCLSSKLNIITKTSTQIVPTLSRALEVEEIQQVETGRGFIENVGVLVHLYEQALGYRDNAESLTKILAPCENPVDEPYFENPYGANLPSYMVKYLNVIKECKTVAAAEYLLYMELMGDVCWLDKLQDEKIRLTFFNALKTWLDEGMLDDPTFMGAMPSTLSNAQKSTLVERMRNTANEDLNSENRAQSEVLEEQMAAIRNLKQNTIKEGYPTATGWYKAEEKIYSKEAIGSNSGSVCATVTLQINQTMTMTRQAFLGTLTVYNGHESKAMKDVKLNLEVTDQHGDLATSHEFQINLNELEGFSGPQNLNEGWTLNGRETGVATVQFIPTQYAAPTEPIEYAFGGTLSYVNPYNGETVVRDLYPVKLTVNPAPVLDLTYFMQRDIMGDNALTPDVVEPMIPSEFSLLIHNKGYGDAKKVNIMTSQPKIIENEKGLLVDFEILSSQVNGKEHNLALGGSVGADFGTIPAHSTSYAQWWLQSTLMGHFIDYDVKATHVTSYGNKDLSLLDQVTIHELIHSLRVPQAEGEPLVGFLANDILDALDTPDALYLSDGNIYNVVSVNPEWITMKQLDKNRWVMNLKPQQSAWHYGNLPDPTAGKARLIKIVRKSDGKELSLYNFWQTSYTLKDGKDPLQEYLLHFADSLSLSAGGTDYELQFEPYPEIPLAVEAFEGLETKNNLHVTPVENVKVRFNKPIDPNTFTNEDLNLTCQGKKLDLSTLTLNTDDNRNFNINLGKTSVTDGYYILTVQTHQITDNEGFNGQNGKNADWIYFLDGKLKVKAEAYPVNAGLVSVSLVDDSESEPHTMSVTPLATSVAEKMVDYDKPITVVAHPALGYQFKGWYLDEALVSTDLSYTTNCLDHTLLKAKFNYTTHNLLVKNHSGNGTVSGAGTGKYEHGAVLTVTAYPNEGYVLAGWMVNGKMQPKGKDDSYTLTLTENTEIEPLFALSVTDSSIGDVDNDGTITVYDVMMLREYLSGQKVEGFHWEYADVNGDGTVTIVDVSDLVDKILKSE